MADGERFERLELPIRAILTGSVALGIAGDILLRGRGEPGPNFLLLFAALGVVIWTLCGRAGLTLSREALVTLGAGILLATTFVLRASTALRPLAFLAVAVAFAIPALKAGAAWLRQSGVSQHVEAVAWAGVNALAGPFRAVRVMLAGMSSNTAPASVSKTKTDRHPARAALRGLLLAVPFLLVFGALFVSADRVFAQLVSDWVNLDYEEIISHVFVTGFLSWLACGFLTGFLTGTRLVSLPETLGTRPAVGIVEIGIALALVNLLFLLFVGVQFRYLFGGANLVEVTPGLTYAEYVREGFGQLAVACALVLPSLLAADWILRVRNPRDALVFRVLGGLLLLLLVVIIASALQRVRVYQAAYGLTESRFYAAAFVGWLMLLTVWFAGTVLRGRREQFAFPALVSGFAFVALLVAVNPDAWIARTNLTRAADVRTDQPGEGIDAQYLASLSADAVPTLMSAIGNLPPQSRCVIARKLLKRWGGGPGEDPKHAPDWRTWNWTVARARQRVTAEADALRAMVADGTTEACPTGD